MSFVVRYFFDPGSGVCLWAKNKEAREKYGYSIDHWELPLSENTKRWLQFLVAWFDTSIDWSAPSDTDDFWSTGEVERFKSASNKGYELLKKELPHELYEIIDETNT